jgi:hypothetical protein
MKIRPEEANLSDLLRRFNLPLPTGPQRAVGTGTATAQALPKPTGSKGAPATPATAGGPTQGAPRPGAASPATTGSASTSTEPNLDTLLDAVGSFVSEATADATARLPPEPRSDVRASQRLEQQPSNGRTAPRAGADAGEESRFVSRVSPQVIARPGLLAPSPQKGAPDPRSAVPLAARAETRPEAAPGARSEASVEQPAQRPEPQRAQAQPVEPRATAELPRHELSARAEEAASRAEMPNQPALSPRAPGLEASTMQHWAAVEVSARTLPRNVRGDVTATPSDPPKKGGRRRSGGATENDWFGARVVRSNAYAIVFTLLGLLTLFVMARSCS